MIVIYWFKNRVESYSFCSYSKTCSFFIIRWFWVEKHNESKFSVGSIWKEELDVFSPGSHFHGETAPGKWPCAFPYLVLCHPTSIRSKAVPWWTTTKQVVGGGIAIARFLYFLVLRWSSCFCFLVKVPAIPSPLNFSSRNSFCERFWGLFQVLYYLAWKIDGLLSRYPFPLSYT